MPLNSQSKSNIHKRVMKSALVVSYISYLAFSAINAQQNQSIDHLKTGWFQVDDGTDKIAIRCVYNSDVALGEKEYFSNSTIGEQDTDKESLEHCYREYCIESLFTCEVVPTFVYYNATLAAEKDNEYSERQPEL